MNELLYNPIKINIKKINYKKIQNENNINKYEYDISTEKSILVLGNIEKEIIDSIKNYSKNKNKKSEKILKKHYGNDFSSKLNLYNKKKGGDINNNNIDDIDIDFNDIDFNLLDIIESEPLYTEPLSNIVNKKQKEEYISNFNKLYNTEISIYMEDTIKQLKEKIFLITKIQPYKQYILFNNKQLGYKFQLYDNDINININNIIIEDNLQIYNIPVNNKLYNNRDNLKVISLENNILIKYLYQKQIINVNSDQLEFDIFNIDDLFIENKKEIANIIKDDIEQKEMIYYSYIFKYFPYFTIELFEDYIFNESNIEYKYTDIYLNYEKLNKIYKYEKIILDKHYNEINSKKYIDFINNEFIQTIVKSDIDIINNNIKSNLNVFNIRNIFDLIEITSIENLLYIQYNTIFDNNKVQLVKINKYIKNTFKNINIQNESILLKFNLIYEKYNITKELKRELIFIIDKYGNYKIKIELNDTLNITYEKLVKLIIDIINPIIELLNKQSFYINFNTENKLKLINKYNINLSNINIILLWKKTLSIDGYNKVKETFSEYINAGIYLYKSENIITNEIEYIINKGVYDYILNKNLYTNNDFQYLTDPNFKQRWNNAYNNTKLIKILPKITNLMIELDNITYNEINYIINNIYMLLYLNNNKIDKINTKQTFLEHKSIKQLKQIDPILYKYKDSDNKYSRKCQKKVQPIIVTKNEIDEKKLKNVIKYKNFTTDKENYYYCPNKKYPFIKFLQNIHPNNYCIPCCKKKDYKTVQNSKYNNIHERCLTEYTYPTDIVQTDKSRYVINYGNIIIINRLMYLPTSLNIMLNTIKNEEKFYIYGIEQHISNIQNIGLLYILANVYNISLTKFIQIIIEFLSDNQHLFNILLEGKLYKYFTDISELITIIKNIFILNKLFQVNIEFIYWNDLFQDIVSYLNIYIIIFEDTNSNISYKPYKSIQTMNNIFNSKYNKINKFVYVIKKNNNEYYPIYYINFNDFYKNNKIKQKEFEYNDNISLSIKQLILNEYNSITNDININLDTINDFIIYNKNYKIIEYYINKKHHCYALILLHITTNNHIYIAINNSNITEINKLTKIINKLNNDSEKIIIDNNKIKIKLNYNSFNRNKYKLNYKNLFKFITEYNLFIFNYTIKLKKINERNLIELNNDIKNYFTNLDLLNLNEIKFNIINKYSFIYKFLYIQQFIILKKNNTIEIIGFICNNLQYYINPIITIDESINILKNNINSIKTDINTIIKTSKYNENNINNIITRKFLLFNTITNYIYDINIIQYNKISDIKSYYKILYYDPDSINKLLLDNNKKEIDNRVKYINNSIYNKYIYNLLIIEIINKFKSYKDNKLRNIIKKTINNLNKNKLTLEYLEYNYKNILYENISTYIIKTYLKNIKNVNKEELINNIYDNLIKMITPIIINNNISINIKYDLIINIIDNNNFIFDNMVVNLFKYMEKTDIIIELKDILKNNIYIDNKLENKKNIDNLTSCTYNNNNINIPYCYKKKLIINNKQQYDTLIDMIATDIKNTLKQDIILNPLFIDIALNKMNFNKYINEIIYIKKI